MIYKKLQLCNSCNLSNCIHNVEIQWAISGHYNSKLNYKTACKTLRKCYPPNHLPITYLPTYLPTHPHMTHLLTYLCSHQLIHLLAHSLTHPPCHDPNLGFTTKTMAWKDASLKCKSRVTFALMGVRRNVWGNEPTHSQMDSYFESWSLYRIPRFSKNDFKGQNSLD
jgi:hypothetical protein